MIFCPYPFAAAPSQRFRYEQYLPWMKKAGLSYHICSFLDTSTHAILYRKGYTLQKIWGVMKGYLRRCLHVYRARQADYILLHREAAPLGPPVFEWVLTRLWNKKLIYDFDDAIWLPDSAGINSLGSRLKWHQKVGLICRWSYKVSAGNAYLCAYARRYGATAIINPTTIDTEHLHNSIREQTDEVPVIGWTGSHSTMRFLKVVVPVLQQLARNHTFRVLIISDREQDFQLPNLEFIPWHAATEIKDLLRMHIGMMPLTEDPWAQGKCGFKALQYLALGIPAVVSPVGVNKEIVEEGIHGYLCEQEEQWYAALSTLISDASLRARMGAAGRKKIEEQYSVKANRKNFLGLFS